MSDQQLEQCQKIISSYKYSTKSPQDFWKELHKGVLVEGNKYFWVDKQARLGIQLYARALDIIHGPNPEYWTHDSEIIPNTHHTVEVAKLITVCWLDVTVKFDMSMLTVGEEYEVFFDIELIRGAGGWNCQVKFEYNDPLDSMSKFIETSLDHLIGAGRVEILVGKFIRPSIPIESPEAAFKMYEHGGQWKDGLIVRGVFIKPAINSKYKLRATTTSVLYKAATM